MRLDGTHFGEAQGQLAVTAELLQRRVVETAQRHADELELIGRSNAQMFKRQRPGDDLLDGLVGEYFAEEDGFGFRRQRRAEIAAESAYLIDVGVESACRL